MTARGFVILSAAKDLERAFLQQTRLAWLCGLMSNQKMIGEKILGRPDWKRREILWQITQAYQQNVCNSPPLTN
jgi:hypothetical protein